MYMIEIRDQFTAAHAVVLPDGCRESSHSHCWHLRLFLSRKELDENNMVVDFTCVQSALKEVVSSLENADLNRIESMKPSPTAEVVAHFIFDQMTQKMAKIAPSVKVKSLSLSEAENCWAWYTCCS
jgi:6-pyruvoyltetrahydropterin/6-carboxytetrahydropterin synthase